MYNMYKYFLNTRQLQRSFSHIGPKFHNRGRMGTPLKNKPMWFGKTILFVGITGIIIKSADRDTLAAVVRAGQRR